MENTTDKAILMANPSSTISHNDFNMLNIKFHLHALYLLLINSLCFTGFQAFETIVLRRF